MLTGISQTVYLGGKLANGSASGAAAGSVQITSLTPDHCRVNETPQITIACTGYRASMGAAIITINEQPVTPPAPLNGEQLEAGQATFTLPASYTSAAGPLSIGLKAGEQMIGPKPFLVNTT